MADRVNSPTAKDQMLPKASGTQGSAGRQRAFSLRFGLNSGSPGADWSRRTRQGGGATERHSARPFRRRLQERGHGVRS